MVMATEIPGYLSIKEAAEFFGVTDSLVRRWVRDNRLPYKRVGSRVKLVPVSAAEKFAKIERKPGPKQP
jgi:excisionase family DNA binding protein